MYNRICVLTLLHICPAWPYITGYWHILFHIIIYNQKPVYFSSRDATCFQKRPWDQISDYVPAPKWTSTRAAAWWAKPCPREHTLPGGQERHMKATPAEVVAGSCFYLAIMQLFNSSPILVAHNSDLVVAERYWNNMFLYVPFRSIWFLGSVFCGLSQFFCHNHGSAGSPLPMAFKK